MTENSAWLISNDNDLIATWGNCLQTASEEFAIIGLSANNWQAGDRPQSTPSVVIVDLRDPAHFSFAAEIRQEFLKGDQRLPIVGICGDQGLPLESAIETYFAISCFTSANCPADITTFLADVKRQELKKETLRVTLYREFEGPSGGSSGKFVSWEPTLAPTLDRLKVAANYDFTLLLIGETGTGKTTLARVVHDISPRQQERFVTVACGSLPDELIDSELFGHVRGAFTGADKDKEGKFEAADNGSILLDEVDVLGMQQQASLLRILESGEFERVGSNDTRKVNSRTIVASNVNLEELIETRRFRSDLYYRLNQVKFEIPALKNRPRDIVRLAMSIVLQGKAEKGLPATHVSPEYLDALQSYHWPGNIRELKNEVSSSAIFAMDGVMRADSLSPAIAQAATATKTSQDSAGLAGTVGVSERQAIEQMLTAQNNNRAATARALGISRVTLYNKIRKYQIDTDGDES